MAEAVHVRIPSAGGPVPGIWYPVEHAPGALVLVGGAGGGTHGPSGVYADVAERMQWLDVAALLLDYRNPNKLSDCVADVRAGIAWLAERSITRIALVGWSFGGAVVITAGAASPAVVGVATIASQTYGTEAVSRLAPRSALFIHGTRDTVLPDLCSRTLYAQAGEPKELMIYAGDGHGIELHRADLVEKLYEWAKGLLLPEQDMSVESAS